MPKVSIIVPVYKAEKYIRRCLDSIIVQTFTDWECLLIDDGSPDSSGKICDEYAEKDSRFRVFHKENGGVSSARNVGIDNALGEYSIHADPDDWMDKDMLMELFSKIVENDADIAICSFYCVKNETIIKTISINTEAINSKSLLRDILQQKCFASCWNKLIRVVTYKKYNIRFPENLTIWEDQFFLCNILMNPLKICYTNKPLYYYDTNINPNSLMNRSRSLDVIYSHEYFVSCFSRRIKDKHMLDMCKVATKNKMFIDGNLTGCQFYKYFEEINPLYYSTIVSNSYLKKFIRMSLSFPYLYRFMQICYRVIKHVKMIIE